MPDRIDLFNQQELYNATRRALGTSIETPIPAFLGYLDDSGRGVVKIPNPSAEDVGKVYYTQAYSEDLTQALGVGRAYNTGLGALADEELVFGTPIYVRRDPQSPNDYYVAGTRPRQKAGFGGDVPPKPELGVIISKTGLLDITSPESMLVIVYGAPYTLDGAYQWIDTQYSADFTSLIPSTDGQALEVLVQVDFATRLLDITGVGAEFDASLTPAQVWAMDGGSGTYFVQPDTDKFRSGYVRLVHGMTAITRSLIWAVQEILTKTSGGSTDTAAIHVNVASEIHGITAKSPPVGADEVVIEDSAASYAKKRATITDILGLGATDPNAIHKATASEIHGITAKTTAEGADEVVIEDSAASYAKKRATIKTVLFYGMHDDYVVVADNTIGNTTTETAFFPTINFDNSLPYQRWVVNRVYQWELSGYVTSAAVPGTFRVRLKVGSTVLADSTALTFLGGLSSTPWRLSLRMTCRTDGASGVVQTDAAILTIGQTFPTSAVSLLIPSQNTTSLTLTGTTQVNIYWTWGTADVSNTITMTEGFLRFVDKANFT